MTIGETVDRTISDLKQQIAEQNEEIKEACNILKAILDSGISAENKNEAKKYIDRNGV